MAEGADAADVIIGGTFRVGWKMRRDGHVWKHVKTRLISFDETAVNVRRILQEDLETGELGVFRNGPDPHRGYSLTPCLLLLLIVDLQV